MRLELVLMAGNESKKFLADLAALLERAENLVAKQAAPAAITVAPEKVEETEIEDKTELNSDDAPAVDAE